MTASKPQAQTLPEDVEKRLKRAMKLINLSGYGPELNDISADPDDILQAVSHELTLQAQAHAQELDQAVQKERERVIERVVGVASTADKASLPDVLDYRKRILETLKDTEQEKHE